MKIAILKLTIENRKVTIEMVVVITDIDTVWLFYNTVSMDRNGMCVVSDGGGT